MKMGKNSRVRGRGQKCFAPQGGSLQHCVCDVCVKSLSHVRLFATHPMDCSLPGSSVHGIFPGKSTGVGCHFLLQRIPTQGSNPGLLHCGQTLYRLSHPEQVASLCPMTTEADSKPRSPHTALLGRKMGAGRGFVLILESCVSKEESWGSEKDSQALRGAKAGFGG